MFKPLFAEAICSQTNLVADSIKHKQSEGGCCKPDSSGKGCLPLTRGEFDACCRTACGLINQTYGCTLDCNNGVCDQLSNPFSQPSGPGINGAAMFESCRNQYCPGACSARDFLKKESEISTCCNNQCKMDAGCIYDCGRAADGYRKNWGGDDMGGGGDGTDGGGIGGGGGNGGGGNGGGDDIINEIRKQFIENAIKNGVPVEIINQVADCALKIFIPKFGTAKLLDEKYTPTDEEKAFMLAVVANCVQQASKPVITPPKPVSPTTGNKEKSWVEKNELWVFMAIGLAVLVVIFLVIFFMMKGKKGKSGKRK